ncbi:MAG: hypothetical protein JWQ41_2740 [Variovorax sp.]|nr:hypothetical protein [Variovorax sp.]
MTASKILAAAAFSLLAVAGAHADVYDNIPNFPGTSQVSRAEVSAGAYTAARSADPYREGATASMQPSRTSTVDRASVREQAVAAAHAKNQTVQASSYVNSRAPSSL